MYRIRESNSNHGWRFYRQDGGMAMISKEGQIQYEAEIQILDDISIKNSLVF